MFANVITKVLANTVQSEQQQQHLLLQHKWVFIVLIETIQSRRVLSQKHLLLPLTTGTSYSSNNTQSTNSLIVSTIIIRLSTIKTHTYNNLFLSLSLCKSINSPSIVSCSGSRWNVIYFHENKQNTRFNQNTPSYSHFSIKIDVGS